MAPVGLVVGFMVGVTGIGGGALMTPLLVFLGIDPLTAVSSDLVVSLVMKPVGSAVHLRRGTVHRRLVLWLAAGSIPSAFAGAVILHEMGDGADLKANLKRALGVALILAVAGIALRSRLERRHRGATTERRPVVRVVPTVLVGIMGGLIVGMTSVGSGSLMIVCLMLLYPRLHTPTLVGTDLAQAIPLVGSAALGHALFGNVQFSVAGPLLIGALPAVYVGARLSSAGTFRWIRPLLILLLILSATQLLGGSPQLLGLMLGIGALGFAEMFRRGRQPAPVAASSMDSTSTPLGAPTSTG